jgi:hypothetical protein
MKLSHGSVPGIGCGEKAFIVRSKWLVFGSKWLSFGKKTGKIRGLQLLFR